MFSEHEQTGIYGFDISADKVNLMEFSESMGVSENIKYKIKDNVLYFERSREWIHSFMYTDLLMSIPHLSI
nr:hypothetical protein [uncultured bacterium]